jgi:hypothetical protein
LLRKASLERSLRWTAAAARAGAAWLGLGVLLADDNPLATLGLIAVLFALAGGRAGQTVERPAALRVASCLVLVALARWAAGPLAAALAAGCLTAGWALRVRVRDGILALALVGAGVAAVSRPSGHLVLAFATLGVLTVAARPLVNAVGNRIQRVRRALAARRDSLATLGAPSSVGSTTRLSPAAPMTDVPTLQSDVLEVNR